METTFVAVNTVTVSPCGNLTIDVEIQVMTNSKDVKKGARLVLAGAKKAEQKRKPMDWKSDQRTSAAKQAKLAPKKGGGPGRTSARSTLL